MSFYIYIYFFLLTSFIFAYLAREVLEQTLVQFWTSWTWLLPMLVDFPTSPKLGKLCLEQPEITAFPSRSSPMTSQWMAHVSSIYMYYIGRNIYVRNKTLRDVLLHNNNGMIIRDRVVRCSPAQNGGTVTNLKLF